jgi:hypothetical protein
VQLFDGVVFNPEDPVAYLKSLTIKRDLRIENVVIDRPVVQVA